MLSAIRLARPRAPDALPKLHGRKLGDSAVLRSVRSAAPLAVPGLRFRERAHGQVLRRLRQAERGDHHSSCSAGSEARAATVRQCCSAESRASENHGLLRLFWRGSSTAFLPTDDDGRSDRAPTMITVPKKNFRTLA